MTDFTSESDGWRPLDRTKYRLQKGDQQLKSAMFRKPLFMNYREMYQREPAHHIPELLSELSFMVYRARIESKERLCKYVRSKVNNHFLVIDRGQRSQHSIRPNDLIKTFFSI